MRIVCSSGEKSKGSRILRAGREYWSFRGFFRPFSLASETSRRRRFKVVFSENSIHSASVSRLAMRVISRTRE